MRLRERQPSLTSPDEFDSACATLPPNELRFMLAAVSGDLKGEQVRNSVGTPEHELRAAR
jgi:hypothetical protein